ncbi:hypothetical protein CFC21_087066 [Triticum aestivum]|uniref:Uncharacterized protein n=2 Tax=Triticum aestivum TaxID=4565 RepID=A0A3B6PJ18_WHEAT|nr:uncharacterized protein LOC123133722 [Triticum aestivum]KAF7083259.1 hypothetical protein CFC21_087066 [Triticum aestivum]
MDLEGKICKLAARAAATSPALVRKAVGALERSSAARAAAEVLIYQFLSAVFIFSGFLNLVAVEACGGKNCTVASILFELSYHSGMIALLLLAPACVLFFLRAAGSTSDSEVEDEDRSEIFPWPLIWPVLGFITVAASAAPIAFVLQMCGFREASYQVCVAAVLCSALLSALFYIGAAVALWRMNPQERSIAGMLRMSLRPSNKVAE